MAPHTAPRPVTASTVTFSEAIAVPPGPALLGYRIACIMRAIRRRTTSFAVVAPILERPLLDARVSVHFGPRSSHIRPRAAVRAAMKRMQLPRQRSRRQMSHGLGTGKDRNNCRISTSPALAASRQTPTPNSEDQCAAQ